MRTHVFLSFALSVAAAALCASCAPVGMAPPNKDGGNDPLSKLPDTPIVPDSPRGLLQERIEAAIQEVNRRKLLTTNGFWTIFHGILGMGPKHTTLYDEATGKEVNALDYISKGNLVRGLEFVPMEDGVDVLNGETFVSQGHQDQFIAEMVEWGLPPSHTFRIKGKDYRFERFLNFCKMRASVTKKQELSWAIIVIGEHYGLDAAWTNTFGEKLTFEDILRYELKESIEEAACGGTHRLFGLTWVLHRHLQKGGKVEGLWKEVADKIEMYKQRAKKLRTGDGAFSTDFFKGRGDDKNPDRRINTTGHTVEWLALAMTDEELKSPWMEDAVSALTKLFFDHRKDFIEGGSLYHAMHGLLLYYARVYGPQRLGDEAPHAPPPPPKK